MTDRLKIVIILV